MLTVNLRYGDPDSLLAPLRHHAKALEPVVLEILAYITLVLGSDANEWRLVQSRGGPNSFSLHRGSKEWHFRGDLDVGVIRVLDRAQRGNVLAEIRTKQQARRFVESLPS